MEYTIHEWKKTLTRNRIQIFICLLLLGFVAVIVGFTYPSKPIPPLETKLLNNITIVSTFERKGGPFFTQGLIFKDAYTLIESTGLYKESVIQTVNIKNMEIIKQTKLEDEDFGEGCEIITINDKTEIFQLTWREKKIHVWDAHTLELNRTLALPEEIEEGWGITKNTEVDPKGNKKQWFYISNGSPNIFIVNPETLEIRESIEIKYPNGTTQKNLNELEFINGKLWANIWNSNRVAVINIKTGYIEYLIDLTILADLAKEESRKKKIFRSGSVLNGIAYYPPRSRLIVTGKNWPLMFEIKVNGL